MDTKTLAQSIGAAFRVARTARGLTTAQAAELLRLQPDFYGRVEGGNSFPTILTCARAVEELGVDSYALLGGPDAQDTLAAHLAGRVESLTAENELMRDLLAAAEDAAAEAEAHRDQLGAQAVLSVHDLTSDRDAALARAESLAAECETLQRELGRVRAERDADRDRAVRWASQLMNARDQIDALEAERETLRMLAELRGEDPDVPAHPDQLRLSLGTGLTPAGLITVAGVGR